MSLLISARGIVLSCKDMGEADRIYHVLTREYGKLEVWGRGARKPLAKLSPHLASAAELDLTLVRSRVRDTVMGVECVRSFAMHQDIDRFLLAHQGLQLVDTATRFSSPDEKLYETVCAWLSLLQEAPPLPTERQALALAGFAMKLLDLLGHRPETRSCLVCTEAIRPGAFVWHPLRGGVLCRSCDAQDSGHRFSTRSFSDNTLKVLRLSLEQSLSSFLEARIPRESLDSFHEAVESLLISHFPTIPASALREAVSPL